MSQEILRVEHLSKSFGTHEVLKDIDFSVDKGEVISIIGSSGSGKSTLLRCVNMLEDPTSGTIYFEGKPISYAPKDKSAFRARVGMVFQNFNLFNNMTVLENCMSGVEIVKKGSKQQARELAEKYLRQVGMFPYQKARPDQLSAARSSASRSPAPCAWSRTPSSSTSRPRRWTPRWSARCSRSSRTSPPRA